MNVRADQLLSLTHSILLAWDIREDDAKIAAELMVETDLRAIDPYGVSMLIMYEKMRERCTLNMNPTRFVVRDTPVLALIDGDAGLGHPIAREAMLMACDKARLYGLGAVGVRNSHHFGATGLYAEMAATQGLLGLATPSTSVAGVIPTHGAKPLLGTNPFAFAAPGNHRSRAIADNAGVPYALAEA